MSGMKRKTEENIEDIERIKDIIGRRAKKARSKCYDLGKPSSRFDSLSGEKDSGSRLKVERKS